jgi:hypothetical protein
LSTTWGDHGGDRRGDIVAGMKKLLLLVVVAALVALARYVAVLRSPSRPQPLRGTPAQWPPVPRKK